MLFRLHESIYLQPGKLVHRVGHPVAISDLDRRLFSPDQVALVIPDDEAQGQRLRAAGFETRTRPLEASLWPPRA